MYFFFCLCRCRQNFMSISYLENSQDAAALRPRYCVCSLALIYISLVRAYRILYFSFRMSISFFHICFFFHSFIVNGAATVESTSHCCAFNMKIRSTVPGRFDAKNKFCMNFHKINFIFIEMANKMELITLLDREVGLERLNIYGRILFYHKWNRHNYKFV